jgi:hypothetical protein
MRHDRIVHARGNLDGKVVRVHAGTYVPTATAVS